MALRRVGYILSLVGGILGVVGGFSLFVMSMLLATFLGESFQQDASIFIWFYIIAGIWYILTGIVVILASQWMKRSQTLKKGSITCLIFGIIGGGGIFSLIGGILGLVDDRKNHM